MIKPKLTKYFWSLNEDARKEVERILKDPNHRKFPERAVAFLSRCDKPKELFYFITKEQFIEAWPRIKAYWNKIAKTSDFRNWWQTVYEQILEEDKARQIKPKRVPSVVFLKIGKAMREARVKKGLSQSELADKVAMKQPDISKIEEGKANVTLDTLVRICRVLGLKKIELFDENKNA
jgi:DNA-binding XRE family transcriptional regulator